SHSTSYILRRENVTSAPFKVERENWNKKLANEQLKKDDFARLQRRQLQKGRIPKQGVCGPSGRRDFNSTCLTVN
ncbi:hypothetical protein AOLI_G00149960, partial [Acnodon oligacanthus]